MAAGTRRRQPRRTPATDTARATVAPAPPNSIEGATVNTPKALSTHSIETQIAAHKTASAEHATHRQEASRLYQLANDQHQALAELDGTESELQKKLAKLREDRAELLQAQTELLRKAEEHAKHAQEHENRAKDAAFILQMWAIDVGTNTPLGAMAPDSDPNKTRVYDTDPAVTS